MADLEQDPNRSRNDESRLLELQGAGRLNQSRSNKRYNKIREARRTANLRDKNSRFGDNGALMVLEKL